MFVAKIVKVLQVLALSIELLKMKYYEKFLDLKLCMIVLEAAAAAAAAIIGDR